MKTPCPASLVLSSLIFYWGIAMTLPLSAQVSYTYTAPPPPGYPASGAPKQSSSKATRQSAAATALNQNQQNHDQAGKAQQR